MKGFYPLALADSGFVKLLAPIFSGKCIYFDKNIASQQSTRGHHG